LNKNMSSGAGEPSRDPKHDRPRPYQAVRQNGNSRKKWRLAYPVLLAGHSKTDQFRYAIKGEI
jgi:hypothetical protein